MRDLTRSTAGRLSIAAVASAGFWLLSTGWELPALVKRLAMGLGVVLMGCAAIAWLGRALLHGLPLPWFPNRPWRVMTWLRRRPALMLVTTNPPQVRIDETAALLLGCAFDLTLQLSPRQAGAPVRVNMADARLEMRQHSPDGVKRRFIFRLVEGGGFHALSFADRQCFLSKFAWTGGPAPLATAPDMHRPYALKLIGARAILENGGGLSGTLPAIVWPPSKPLMALDGLSP